MASNKENRKEKYQAAGITSQLDYYPEIFGSSIMHQTL